MFKLSEVKRRTKSELVNILYNSYARELADYDGDQKTIPYMGWFWRDTDFVGKRITIGRGGGLVGVMENNKWDYPQRDLTPEECDTFIEFIDRAIGADRKGGQLSETHKNTKAVLAELHAWMQTLEVPDDEEDYVRPAASNSQQGTASVVT